MDESRRKLAVGISGKQSI